MHDWKRSYLRDTYPLRTATPPQLALPLTCNPGGKHHLRLGSLPGGYAFLPISHMGGAPHPPSSQFHLKEASPIQPFSVVAHLGGWPPTFLLVSCLGGWPHPFLLVSPPRLGGWPRPTFLPQSQGKATQGEIGPKDHGKEHSWWEHSNETSLIRTHSSHTSGRLASSTFPPSYTPSLMMASCNVSSCSCVGEARLIHHTTSSRKSKPCTQST
ncbi:hypothetical protein DUNSADRAFT_9740 [Dunaliella salina]|uniref:Encoded protein n=1 Tax=Dunaliella salina TaxID=3046 RepID=A0ABQ7GGW5_DUNSA|nr:hypothetical protein DUNSADRAFT_9740 [Dunaliella salina]|eukprot:KAF5833831.1 hypothetical protein DUNSADRAFT_9740 [Dunaliella salina]